MDQHQNLVNSLIVAFQNKSYKILKATNSKYQAPQLIGRHQPDIIAKDSNGLLIIGLAKTRSELTSQTTKEQFLDYSRRMMSEGPLRGIRVPVHIIVPKNQSDSLRQLLTTLGLANKIGENIIIWTD